MLGSAQILLFLRENTNRNFFSFMKRLKTSIQSDRSKYCPRIKMPRLWVLFVSLVLTLLILLSVIILQNSHFPRHSHVSPTYLTMAILKRHCKSQAGGALASFFTRFYSSQRPWAMPRLLERHLYYLHNQAISVNNVLNKSY